MCCNSHVGINDPKNRECHPYDLQNVDGTWCVIQVFIIYPFQLLPCCDLAKLCFVGSFCVFLQLLAVTRAYRLGSLC